MEFYICRHCGNLVAYVEKKGPDVVCCGEDMQLLEPNTTDAAKEKHVPVVDAAENVVMVKIGSVEHPMVEEHHIMWIALHTNKGNQRKILDPTGKPMAMFALSEEEEPIAVYAYCNLHGLWKA